MNEITYSLATIDSPNITSIRILSKEEFEKFASDISLLEKFGNDEALFKLIEFNYEDLIEKEKFYLNEYISNPAVVFGHFSIQFLDLNRLILNLLSSIRTYLDHTETRLKRAFTEKSPEYELFKKLTSESFDNHFAYRFLAKLRNYSQHCGLPTGSIKLTEDQNGHSLKLSLVRDDLLKNFDWGAIVKPELQIQDDEFDIFSLIETKISLLRNVNEKLSRLLLEKLKNEGENLLNLIIETQKKGNGIPLLLNISGNIDNPTMQMRWFPFEVISLITGTKLNVIQPKQ